jgi:hypothetical protein
LKFLIKKGKINPMVIEELQDAAIAKAFNMSPKEVEELDNEKYGIYLAILYGNIRRTKS